MELPKELDKDGSPARAVRRFLSRSRAGARVWPGDDALREAVRTRPFYKAGRSGQRFQVLRRLEESHGASEPVDYSSAKLSVEHVLPQRPAQQWLDLLSEEAEDGEGTEELHALLVHTLGNLTLSGDNVRLSNHPFRRKQEILDSSALRMNQSIAAQERWGREQILARAEDLGERAVRLWPGPLEDVVHTDQEWTGWRELREALLAMPSGTWTSYGDIAALIGTHAVSVGNYLGSKAGVHGAYRVLTADGRISAGFRWTDDQHSGDDPRDLLASEGVTFDTAGRAVRSQRLTTVDLGLLLGREVLEEPPTDEEAGEPQTLAGRFEAQLRDNQTPPTVDGVLGTLGFWEERGGHRAYGKASETSCFPTLAVPSGTEGGRGARGMWPLALYPVTGTVEVVFQHLKRRPPFDDQEPRRELLRRLNEIEGIELAEAKLDLRPSFPMDVFADHHQGVCAVLEWFVRTAATRATVPRPARAARTSVPGTGPA